MDIGSISNHGSSQRNTKHSLDDDQYRPITIVEEPTPFGFTTSENADLEDANP